MKIPNIPNKLFPVLGTIIGGIVGANAVDIPNWLMMISPILGLFVLFKVITYAVIGLIIGWVINCLIKYLVKK